jgi:predicted Kef-type K+ transport protein
MSSEQKATAFQIVKFVVGVILFAALVGIHVWVKELPVWLIALPGALWGIDAAAFLGGRK